MGPRYGLNGSSPATGPLRHDPQGKSAASDSTAAKGAARKPVGDPVYGMSATRGARYLLRNGLDYLDYQQFERALKFLRQAESRQDELNDAERQVLKQGIENAQRGLRETADADSPYALSEQSRERSGIRPAKPKTLLSGRTDRTKAPGRDPRVKRPIPSNLAANDADDQGEPIRLASGETAVDDPDTQKADTSRLTQADGANPGRAQDYDRPRTFPEIPKLPKVAQGLSDADVMATERDVKANQSGKSTGLLPGSSGGAQIAKENVPAPLPLARRPALSRPRCRRLTPAGFPSPYLRRHLPR